MISYKPFYETLFKKGITEYHLIYKQGFSANTLHRMKKGEAISTRTLDALCYVLDCEVYDIIEFIKERVPASIAEGRYSFCTYSSKKQTNKNLSK